MKKSMVAVMTATSITGMLLVGCSSSNSTSQPQTAPSKFDLIHGKPRNIEIFKSHVGESSNPTSVQRVVIDGYKMDNLINELGKYHDVYPDGAKIPSTNINASTPVYEIIVNYQNGTSQVLSVNASVLGIHDGSVGETVSSDFGISKFLDSYFIQNQT